MEVPFLPTRAFSCTRKIETTYNVHSKSSSRVFSRHIIHSWLKRVLGHLAERHLAERHLAEKTSCRKDILPKYNYFKNNDNNELYS